MTACAASARNPPAAATVLSQTRQNAGRAPPCGVHSLKISLYRDMLTGGAVARRQLVARAGLEIEELQGRQRRSCAVPTIFYLVARWWYGAKSAPLTTLRSAQSLKGPSG